ncbi:MAG TPA: SDR family NAD(P)-dependent oxidoreductase [Burkholderiales bacterium]|nr:SDR family NAD(P)-dependent oxidoreductase [Burkholderiales bacterium]
MTQPFAGRTAIVTGGLHGIGRATVDGLLTSGANVAIFDLEEESTDSTARLESERSIYVQVDAVDRGSVDSGVQRVVKKFGRLDILVNNVGGSQPPVVLESLDETGWDRIIALNLKSAYVCTRAVIGRMKAQRYGAIVNLSSQAGRSRSELGNLPYATAKAGILGFTRQLAHEVAPYNIRVNAVAPGVTLTERVLAKWNAWPASQRQAVVAPIPLGRLASPMEIANVILFLASEESSYMTGTCLDVNGGRFML